MNRTIWNTFAIIFIISGFYSCASPPVAGTAQQSEVHPFEPETADYVKNWDERKLAALSEYKIIGTCGGFPKVNVKTAPGFCLGLIDNGDGTVMPRTAVEIAPGKILVVDMGGWAERNGKLYLLTLTNGKYVRTTVVDAKLSKDSKIKSMLDRPHLIAKGPDGLFYLSSVSQITRLNLSKPDWLNNAEVIISGIPALGLHPLKVFTFDNTGNILLNVGSATNVCQKQGQQFAKKSECSEVEDSVSGQAQIRKYTRLSNGTYAKNFQVYARGMRNSMGLMWHKEKNILLQAENGRDNIKEFDVKLSSSNLPHEEFNVIKENGHYGWPYCYDNSLNNPEWTNINCAKYLKPYLLLPAHSAPLSMMIYKGPMFPAWYQNRMIISLHGYEPLGHRIVAYRRDDNGLPTKEPFSIVYGWNEDGTQAKGAPVGLSQMNDGSLLIVEDKSRKVVRLFYDSAQGNGSPIIEIPDRVIDDGTADLKNAQAKERLARVMSDANPPIFARIQANMIDKSCTGCHAGADARGLELAPYDYEGNENRIVSLGKGRQILAHLNGNTEFAQMPPDGFRDNAEKKQMIDLFTAWLNSKGL